MTESSDYESVQVFIGVDVGKDTHRAVAINRSGKRLFDKVLPNDETRLRPPLNMAGTASVIYCVVDTMAAFTGSRRWRDWPVFGLIIFAAVMPYGRPSRTYHVIRNHLTELSNFSLEVRHINAHYQGIFRSERISPSVAYPIRLSPEVREVYLNQPGRLFAEHV